MEDHLSNSIFFSLIFTFIFFFFFIFKSILFTKSTNNFAPRSYPLIGSLFFIHQNSHRFIQWTSDFVNHSPTKTAILHHPLGRLRIFTANPAVVRHILKTNFHGYPKGKAAKKNLSDLLGDGIFNIDGDRWKFQRQVSSREFNTNSLRHFVEHVVDDELNHRLLPILAASAATGRSKTTVLDFQDLLKRFAFDNICKIAFGYDPAYLLPSLPEAIFATAFEEAVMITGNRVRSNLPFIWKLKRTLNVGSEKRLRIAVGIVREFANQIMKEKKLELEQQKLSIESTDLLSRFLTTGDEKFVTDIVVSFIIAGRDTTSAVLTWFFWLIQKNPRIENEILKEIRYKKPETLNFDEIKDMVYTHASLCETMRLYPPVAVDGKEAADDDVLPDGTVVKKGNAISYHIYAMGRSSELWGSDWPEFRPERWLVKDVSGRWVFKSRDVYEYPVFQAGPRVCLGKEMAFLQMKRVVAGVLRRFRVVPATDDGVDPVYVVNLTAKMKGGFPVRIENRNESAP